ncbi:MAG: hypothetical protein QM753_21035 [Thermomicrobiales bacterium]
MSGSRVAWSRSCVSISGLIIRGDPSCGDVHEIVDRCHAQSDVSAKLLGEFIAVSDNLLTQVFRASRLVKNVGKIPDGFRENLFATMRKRLGKDVWLILGKAARDDFQLGVFEKRARRCGAGSYSFSHHHGRRINRCFIWNNRTTIVSPRNNQ